jgi:hypothetical protein
MKDIYGGVDPRSLPAYPLVEAAHYLGLNVSTLGSWFREGALLLPDGDAEQMSFWNLVEAFVLKGLRKGHRMSLQRIRVAMDKLRRLYPELSHPLAQLDLAVLNRDLYADRDDVLVDASRGGQLGIRGVLELYLSRVEKSAGGAIRLYPSRGRASTRRLSWSRSIRRSPLAGQSSPARRSRRPSCTSAGRPATRLPSWRRITIARSRKSKKRSATKRREPESGFFIDASMERATGRRLEGRRSPRRVARR